MILTYFVWFYFQHSLDFIETPSLKKKKKELEKWAQTIFTYNIYILIVLHINDM